MIQLESLAQDNEGMILLTGGAVNGFVGAAAAEGQTALVDERLSALVQAFPGRVYVELQRHGLDVERRAEPVLLDAAFAADVPLVATNDCRFEKRDMVMPHDVLLCIGNGRKLAEDDRRASRQSITSRPPRRWRRCSPIFPRQSATRLIAQRCSAMAEMRKPILPPFESRPASARG